MGCDGAMRTLSFHPLQLLELHLDYLQNRILKEYLVLAHALV